ncbi:MAG TPA: circularly permuted type 2 ATP-grasp protein, partial [Pseudonocardia sp.]|nr:circularly permuted type 2 ATP-grasp protein [Pseudonocardia sp.]
MPAEPAAALPIGLLAGYRPAPAVHDEMVDGAGRLHEQWSHVGRVLDGLGPLELTRRRGEAARLLANDGVNYQLAAGQAATARRWELDPVPLLLGSAQWAEVERGVIQRAELLNLVLTDLYGSRQLLRTGLLPPELVFGHPGFRRQADGIRIPGPQQLFACAADLARDGKGDWWVLSDRTQTPSGFGYSLENRVVVSRVFPSMHRDAQVHRLAPFFRTLRSALQAAAPPTAGEPRIVVLSPGPWSETAFEHAFLASYLGYPLVEGADLTVRDGRVWLRSLGQLEPVDVILRRVDSSYCDPLELRSESLLGVPGLVEACRLGSVSVVNTLGSGVLENPGLLPLLPRLCERLLGEPLRLPSVPTWWCGEDEGRRYVVANLDQLVVKSIGREQGAQTLLGWELSAAERDELRHRIEARPYGWVG